MFTELDLLIETFFNKVVDLTQLVFGDGGYQSLEDGLLENNKLDGLWVSVREQMTVCHVTLSERLPLFTKLCVERGTFLTKHARVGLILGETNRLPGWLLRKVNSGGLSGRFCVVVKPPLDLLRTSCQ